MKRRKLRIEFPWGTTKREIKEILEKKGFRQVNDGSFRKTIYIKIYIPIPINFHCFCREENNKVFLSCHVDYRYQENGEIRETWLISQNGRVNRYSIEKLAKKLSKIIEDVIKGNWEKIKKEIENEMKREMGFKK